MSRVVATRVLMLALALMLGSCGKGSTGPGPDEEPVFGRMAATVGGHPWAALDGANNPAALVIVAPDTMDYWDPADTYLHVRHWPQFAALLAGRYALATRIAPFDIYLRK